MKALFCALTLLLFAAAAPATDAPLSALQFRDRMAAAWQDRFGTAPTPVSPMSFDAKLPDGKAVRVNIDSAYNLYVADPANLDAIIARQLQVLADSGNPGADMLDQLVVIIRPTDYLTASVAPGADLSKFLPTHPFAGDLSLFLAIDSPTAIRTASTDDLDRWHIDLAAAWERGLANIKPRVGTLQMIRMVDENGASGIGGDSGLAPSVLATPGMCGPAAPEGNNGQVVLVISRDAFLFGVPSDPDSMKRFWRDAKASIASDATLSRTPITCQKGAWVAAPVP
jgi:hypothetical protein